MRIQGPSDPVQPQQPEGKQTYIAQHGDTLHSIASKFSISADKLAEANNLSVSDQLKVGHDLLIPEQERSSTGVGDLGEEIIRDAGSRLNPWEEKVDIDFPPSWIEASPKWHESTWGEKSSRPDEQSLPSLDILGKLKIDPEEP
jgi:LysM repeat protein